MKRKLLVLILILSVISSVVVALPVSASPTNPTTIGFYATGNQPIPDFGAFYNLTSSSSGDVLFVAEGFVYYAVPANEPATAAIAFSFEVLSPTGQVMLSTPLNSYGDRPISIYLSASQVTALNTQFGISLLNNPNISFVIAGNPVIFGALTPNVNETTQIVSGSYWFDESKTFTINYNLLDTMQNFMINMMGNINSYDKPTTSYLLLSGGFLYLNDATSVGQSSGTSIMLQGINGLQTWCGAIFKASSTAMIAGAPTTTTAYIQTNQSVQTMLGSTVAHGVDGIRAYLGLANNAGGRTEAGIIITVIACGFLVFYMTKKGFVDQRIIFIACSLVIISFAWLGLFPISVLFVIGSGIAIYTLYYFWTRGIL